MISPTTIEEIKQKMDIVEVVGDFVTLKKSGSSYRALSPFTNERTPSFYVVPSKGIFKDFSSGKGGDSITFIMEVDGLSYVEALKYLAKKYNIEIIEEGRSEEFDAQQSKRESLFIVMNYANEQFQKILWEHEDGRAIGLSYFKERGFSEESIKKFELGFTLDEWDYLLQSAKKEGYQEEILEQAGLIVKKEDKIYDRFRSRVMFPIHNITGKVVAFGARILNTDNGSNKKQPKYLNSPETELYHKSNVLYGIFQAKQAIRQADNCFIVEGYTDVISMHQTGITNVVSSSGTALTEDQIKLISRYTKNVTVIFDGDQAGIKASIRGIDMLLEGGLNVKAVALPEGEDPDSQARTLGTSAFQHFIESESQDIIQFKTKLFLKEAKGDPVKKAEVIKDIIRSISKIDDPVKRTVYLKECSDLLGIQESVLISEQNKLLIQKSREKGKSDYSDSYQELPPELQENLIEGVDIVKVIELQERESIRVLVNYGKHQIKSVDKDNESLISYYLSEMEEINFTNAIYHEILEIIKEKLSEGEIIDGEYLLQNGSEEVKRVVVDLMTPKYELSENWSKKFQIHVPTEIELLKDVTYSNILRLKFRIIQHLIKEENKKIKETVSEDALDEILDEINELKRIEMDIAKILGNVTTK
ncbi:MAG: DNA primase [Cyclobacteriaceae bacterium]